LSVVEQESIDQEFPMIADICKHLYLAADSGLSNRGDNRGIKATKE